MKTYIPAPCRTVVLPGGQRWPEDGRPIDPLSPYETRLVRDGDLVEKPAPKTAGKPKETA